MNFLRGGKAPRVTVPGNTGRGHMDFSILDSEVTQISSLELSRQSQRPAGFKEGVGHGLSFLISPSDKKFIDIY